MADSPPFRFKKFLVDQAGAAHSVGTDSVLLGAWADLPLPCRRMLDIGTGTGIVSLMLIQRWGNFDGVKCIDAIEIHTPSAACARRNFAASGLDADFRVWEGSVQDFAQHSAFSYDLIVSNPPFFSSTTVSPDETRRLGRHIGSLPPSKLIDCALRLLAPQGRFSVILPAEEGRMFCEMAALKGLYFTKITEVRTRRDKAVTRLLLEFRREAVFVGRDELAIYEYEEVYSAQYAALTSAFYTFF